MSNDLLRIVELFANIAVIPLCGILWNVQGRLSRIEGQLSNLTQKGK